MAKSSFKVNVDWVAQTMTPTGPSPSMHSEVDLPHVAVLNSGLSHKNYREPFVQSRHRQQKHDEADRRLGEIVQLPCSERH